MADELEPVSDEEFAAWLDASIDLSDSPATLQPPPEETAPEVASALPRRHMDLAEVLDQVEAFVRRYIVLTEHQAAAIALWIAHTHAIDAAEVTPYLGVTSPERRAGKTRLLEVLASVVRAPIFTTSISPSALFRAVDQTVRTLLFDEIDTVFGRREGNEDLRALLNAGFERGGQVHRSEPVGKTFVERSFDVFAAKALAAIGNLPETISDRSIHVRMQRKTADENVARFRRRLVREDAGRLQASLAAWAVEAAGELAEAWPPLPEDLDDRAQDAWEPLLAIADAAGRGWDGRARAAALALAAEKDSEETNGILLLAHVRDAIDERDRMPTGELLAALVEREDGPWGAWWGDLVDTGRTKGPASRLAKMLKPFGVIPKKMRIGESTVRGYERQDFAEAWARYLPPEQRNNGTRNRNPGPDQAVPLFRSREDGGEEGASDVP